MNWGHPSTFWGLVLLPFLLLVSLRAWVRTGRELVALFGGAKTWAVRTFFSTLSIAVFTVLIVFAASDPRGGRRPKADERSGSDIVLVVDVSRSMLADDLEPSRLDRVRAAIRLLIHSLSDARFALVPFKGEAMVAVPMTEDRVILELWLDRLGPGLSTTAGTDLESALRTARLAFPPDEGRRRILMLFSDGEALSGKVAGMSIRLSEEGLMVYSVAAGTRDGAQIRLPDGSYVKDSQDRIVISRADVQGLRKLAEDGGGVFIDLSQSGSQASLAQAVEDDRVLAENRGIQFQTVSRYRAFLIPALLFLFMSFLARVLPWREE